jgi:hypothetical protein
MEVIAWILVALAGLGLIYTGVLIAMFIALPKDDEYLDDYECSCIRCNR